MKLRKNILTALLLAIGFILHQVTPGLLGSMKFDLMLAFMFVALFISKDFQSTVVTALLGGILTAMTTTFPGGQIPNIIDKLVTCIAVYIMIKVLDNFKNKQVSIGIIAFLGTMISGTTFLYSALIIVGLPAPFTVLFFAIVLPTTIANTFITIIVYNAVKLAMKVTRINYLNQ